MNRNFIFKGGVTKFWWIPLLTGLLSIGIGIWCLFSPQTSLPILAYAFAGVICAAGIFNLTFAFVNSKLFPGWGWSLAMGFLELLCGIWMFSMSTPVLTSTFMWIVGFYLIFAVVNAICDSCTFYGYANDWFGWILAVLLITLLFAAIFISGPIAGGIAVWLYIGIAFIMFGFYRILMAGKIRKINRKLRY